MKACNFENKELDANQCLLFYHHGYAWLCESLHFTCLRRTMPLVVVPPLCTYVKTHLYCALRWLSNILFMGIGEPLRTRTSLAHMVWLWSLSVCTKNVDPKYIYGRHRVKVLSSHHVRDFETWWLDNSFDKTLNVSDVKWLLLYPNNLMNYTYTHYLYTVFQTSMLCEEW